MKSFVQNKLSVDETVAKNKENIYNTISIMKQKKYR